MKKVMFLKALRVIGLILLVNMLVISLVACDAYYFLGADEVRNTEDGGKEAFAYYEDGALQTYYKKDKKGNLVVLKYYEQDGTLIDHSEREFDDKGNIIEITTYNADGSIQLYQQNEYDENEKIIKSITTYFNGNIEETQYDENGKAVVSVKFDVVEDEKIRRGLQKFEYDKNGNLLNSIRFIYWTDGMMTDIEISEYNLKGELISRNTYDVEMISDGLYSFTDPETGKITNYDKDGNRIE